MHRLQGFKENYNTSKITISTDRGFGSKNKKLQILLKTLYKFSVLDDPIKS